MPDSLKKHYEPTGPFAGLWVRTARALRNGGYETKEAVRRDIESGRLWLSQIHDYGLYAHREVLKWLGISDDESLRAHRTRMDRTYRKSAEKPIQLLSLLDRTELSYKLTRHRGDSIRVTVADAGLRMLIEAFDDGRLHISRFRNDDGPMRPFEELMDFLRSAESVHDSRK